MSTEAIFSCRPNLLVADLQASLRFYAESLGFRVGWRWSDRQNRFLAEEEHLDPGEPGTALVGRDRAQIILTQVAGPHSTRLHFDVHTSIQVDALFEEWRANGAAIAEPPKLRPWGMYEMRLHDPDGHMLRVSAPP
ncbi:catechol 2,3-dioxygenase-like lactoylglutathione lyase family enzyme [Kibdelosporangium banguiense]|uniref:Catechol 2,3-dioxygenase-like lactoylglutathione lyase family enzyme n=1 Tax=Kibdelosporangium banguiense TaxID=1365924 RepID=A0ABS4T5Q6_9PSEU|nr:VOC family protein [Kibdelosporangium banguiense]MBP2319801.1 catechol 2,3-dioxygenase-like lactoylglutathione lyase family enzyme [Kibdelosporangium banguiense]